MTKAARKWFVLLVVAAAAGGCDKAILSSGEGDASNGGYTILLYVLRSVDHVERIKEFKEQTAKDTGWKGMFIVHKAEDSELYWGKYATYEAAAKDLKNKAKKYRTKLGVPAYAKAIVVPIPGKDVGPPEWNLLNAKGAYTVVVAVFYNIDTLKYYDPKSRKYRVEKIGYRTRKIDAVEYCRELREKGEEAYFHHGPSQSKVTVGAFADSAVVMVERDGVTKPEIREPRIDAIVRKYKFLAVNGYSEKRSVINPKTGKVERVHAKPCLVHIPRRNKETPSNAVDRIGNLQPG